MWWNEGEQSWDSQYVFAKSAFQTKGFDALLAVGFDCDADCDYDEIAEKAEKLIAITLVNSDPAAADVRGHRIRAERRKRAQGRAQARSDDAGRDVTRQKIRFSGAKAKFLLQNGDEPCYNLLCMNGRSAANKVALRMNA